MRQNFAIDQGPQTEVLQLPDHEEYPCYLSDGPERTEMLGGKQWLSLIV